MPTAVTAVDRALAATVRLRIETALEVLAGAGAAVAHHRAVRAEAGEVVQRMHHRHAEPAQHRPEGRRQLGDRVRVDEIGAEVPDRLREADERVTIPLRGEFVAEPVEASALRPVEDMKRSPVARAIDGDAVLQDRLVDRPRRAGDRDGVAEANLGAGQGLDHQLGPADLFGRVERAKVQDAHAAPPVASFAPGRHPGSHRAVAPRSGAPSPPSRTDGRCRDRGRSAPARRPGSSSRWRRHAVSAAASAGSKVRAPAPRSRASRSGPSRSPGSRAPAPPGRAGRTPRRRTARTGTGRPDRGRPAGHRRSATGASADRARRSRAAAIASSGSSPTWTMPIPGRARRGHGPGEGREILVVEGVAHGQHEAARSGLRTAGRVVRGIEHRRGGHGLCPVAERRVEPHRDRAASSLRRL